MANNLNRGKNCEWQKNVKSAMLENLFSISRQ